MYDSPTYSRGEGHIFKNEILLFEYIYALRESDRLN